MKNTRIFRPMAFLLVCTFFNISCEKTQTETDLPLGENQVEAFNSKTGNNDSAIEAGSEVFSPLLHIRYDASLNKEEASALFNKAVSKYMKENGQANKTASYFYFEVWTRTSNYAHSQTDGSVWARFNFLTDQGIKNLPWAKLNNEGDDRQNGAWDFYYFGTHASSINWLEAKSTQVALRGTDGWHVKYFDIRVWASKQFSSATGNSRVLSNPETWLDNTTATGWDYYYTGNVGTGRMNFN